MVEPGVKGTDRAANSIETSTHSSRENATITSTSTSNLLAKSSPAGVSI